MTQEDDLSESWPTFKNCAHESEKKTKKTKKKPKKKPKKTKKQKKKNKKQKKQKTVRSSLLVTHHGIKNTTLLINALLHTMQP